MIDLVQHWYGSFAKLPFDDGVKLLVELLTPLSVLLVYAGYRSNRKKHYYDAIQACQKRYLDIVQRQQELELAYFSKPKDQVYIEKHLILFRDHLGLVSEEITYIRAGMLPSYVGKAWLCHMASRVPYHVGKQWTNKVRMLHAENRELTSLDEKRMLSTFASFDQLKLLFSETEGKRGFSFTARPEAWQYERQRFAQVMYHRIHPRFYRRWWNRLWPEWRRWRLKRLFHLLLKRQK